jgi:uncharacterized protein
MRGLLDINVLIALLDTDHSLHHSAASWYEANANAGWASCALTQNGCLRIMSHASYPHAMPITAVAERLREAAATSHHEFWSADVSLLDADLVDTTRIHGPKQLTDVYLLALACRHRGCLVTLDQSVTTNAVRVARPENLLKI